MKLRISKQNMNKDVVRERVVKKEEKKLKRQEWDGKECHWIPLVFDRWRVNLIQIVLKRMGGSSCVVIHSRVWSYSYSHSTCLRLWCWWLRPSLSSLTLSFPCLLPSFLTSIFFTKLHFYPFYFLFF